MLLAAADGESEKGTQPAPGWAFRVVAPNLAQRNYPQGPESGPSG